MEAQPWDRGTCLVHSALAVTVIAQLFTGLVVASGNRPEWLLVHTILGIITSVVIVIHWLWSWARRDIRVLFPWSRAGLARVARELFGIFQGELPGHGDEAGLSSFVHGVGLLGVSGMAVTGLLMYAVIPGGYGLSLHSTAYAFFTALATTHLWLSYVVWFYLGGHILFAALHELQGNRLLRRIYLGRS
ncbi:MAG TPA: cytochrome b/b6 domain-containing protein [Acidiferrobacter sp.]|nr:cytochrome b/b6 domain-containing protein [Acidiferrobacter sp.]